METVNRMEEEIQESDLLHFQKNQLMKSEQEDGPNLCAETILMSTALPKIAKFVNFTFQKMWISITGNKCINIVHPDSFFKYSQGRRNVFEYGEIRYFWNGLSSPPQLTIIFFEVRRKFCFYMKIIVCHSLIDLKK